MSSIKFDLLPNEFLIFIEHYNNLSYLSSIPSVFYVVLCFYSYILVYYFKNGKKKQEICRFRFLTEDLIQEPQMNIKKCCDINIDMIPSYIIKKKLSFFVILTLFLQILCEYFSFSNRKVFNFFYVEVGKVLVWILSILLLRLNMINRKKPKFYTNGLFWLLSFCFDILLCVSLKIELEINSYHLILILLRTTIEFILTIYGYFKLNDTNYDKNFVTQTLDNLENSKLFRFLFISKRQINENIQSTELRPIVNSLSNSPNHMKYSKEPPPSTNIIIRIDRFISYRTDNLAGNTVIPSNVFFYIRTYKDIQYFVSEKSFTEFEKFLVSLKNKAYVNKSEIWDYVNNAKIQEEDLESSEKILPLISFLEDFLQILVNDPFYYSKTEVLYFLNIPKKKKKPTVLLLTPPRKYTKFIDMSPILTTSTNKSELYLKESLPFEIIEDGYSNENSALTKSFILRISALDYKQNSINNTVEFNFQITNLSHLPSKDWIISKTYTCFKNLNEDLENHLGVKIALFDSLVPKLSNYLYLNKPEFLNKRKEALLKYLEAIIKNINYHGEVLYNFLNFDAEKGNSNSSRNLFGYNNQSTKVNCVSAKILSGKLKNSLFGKYQEEIKFSYNFNYENDRKETILKKQQDKYSIFESRKKIVNGINFHFVEIRLKSFKEVKIINRFNGGEELFNFYYIDLEEFFEKSIKIRTQIKMVKKYRDFLDFNHIINNLHLNFGQPIINLPDSIKSNEENDYEFIKEKWSHYFKEIAMSPRVEENESFKEFFCLNRLGDNFQYHRNKVESLDFTH